MARKRGFFHQENALAQTSTLLLVNLAHSPNFAPDNIFSFFSNVKTNFLIILKLKY